MWFRRDPRITWLATAGNPAAPAARAPGSLEPMSTVELAKLHATGNDFLVSSRLDADSLDSDGGVGGSAPRRRSRSATGTGASVPTA